MLLAEQVWREGAPRVDLTQLRLSAPRATLGEGGTLAPQTMSNEMLEEQYRFLATTSGTMIVVELCAEGSDTGGRSSTLRRINKGRAGLNCRRRSPALEPICSQSFGTDKPCGDGQEGGSGCHLSVTPPSFPVLTNGPCFGVAGRAS